MCGRTNLTASPEELAEAFGLDEVPSLAPRYNIAPGQPMPAVRADARRRRRLELLRWGLVPSWAEDADVGARLINARSETARSRAAFRDSLRERRCLIPASGFFEWRERDGGRQPWLIRRKDGRPMGLAGVWDRWQRLRDGGEPLETCAILTTPANELVAALHDRMPLVLDPADFGLWLDLELRDPARLQPLLRAFPAEQMMAYPVSPRVNSPEHDDPACVEPIAPEEAEDRQRSLF